MDSGSAWPAFIAAKYLVASNDHDEMEKAVKHNDLIANCIMLQNVIDITDVCHALIKDGYTITAEDLSHMSPYLTEQIKRFGEYVLDLEQLPANHQLTRDKSLFNRSSLGLFLNSETLANNQRILDLDIAT